MAPRSSFASPFFRNSNPAVFALILLSGCQKEEESTELPPRPVKTVAVSFNPDDTFGSLVGEVQPRFETNSAFARAARCASATSRLVILWSRERCWPCWIPRTSRMRFARPRQTFSRQGRTSTMQSPTATGRKASTRALPRGKHWTPRSPKPTRQRPASTRPKLPFASMLLGAIAGVFSFWNLGRSEAPDFTVKTMLVPLGQSTRSTSQSRKGQVEAERDRCDDQSGPPDLPDRRLDDPRHAADRSRSFLVAACLHRDRWPDRCRSPHADLPAGALCPLLLRPAGSEGETRAGRRKRGEP